MKDYKEFKLNEKPSPRDNRDFLVEALPDVALPEEFDLKSYLTPIRDQGSQGTCAAQTAACIKEWQERKDVKFIHHMSPQFVYNNRENKHSEGMYGRNVMEILNKIGIVAETDYPYWSKHKIIKELYNKAKNFKIAGYAKIRSVNDLKQALYKNGPCYISVPVYNHGIRMWKQLSPKDEMLGGHAMCLVGFNKYGFIIRNSWGTDWGENGHCIFPYRDWGCQWDVWTTIDASSVKILKPEKKKKKRGFFGSIWYCIKYICTFGKCKK